MGKKKATRGKLPSRRDTSTLLWSEMKPAEKFEHVWAEETPEGSDYVPEYRFHPDRKWRFDYAWPAFKVAVEIQGFGKGGFGGHQRQAGVEKDNEKCNMALTMGWRVLRYDTRSLGLRDKVSDAVAQTLQVIILAGEENG